MGTMDLVVPTTFRRMNVEMEFWDPEGRVHSLDAREAVRVGMDLRTLVLNAFRFAAGDLTEFPESQVKATGAAREKLADFFRFTEGELRKELPR